MRSLLSLVLIVAVIALGEGLSSGQQPPKVPRIGFLSLASPSNLRHQSLRQAFLSGLRRLGYIEGQNIVIEYRYARGELDNLTHFATELVRLNVSLIVAASRTPIDYAMKATKTIPIVMAGGGNVVKHGIVESLTRPGGNVTGLSRYLKGSTTKRMELFKETLPSISRVAVLNSSPRKSALRTYKRVGKALGVDVQAVEFRRDWDIEEALSSIAVMRPDALITIGPVRRRHAKKIVQFTLKMRLPSMHPARRLAILGGLMSYDVNQEAIYSRAAVYVDKILKGANPATLPIEPPRYELMINLKTARKIGVKIPPEILLEANEIIK